MLTVLVPLVILQAKTVPPLPGLIHPLTGKVEWTDPFGAARGGGTRKHEGLDIGAPKLRPVVACFAGTVSLAVGMGGLGRAVFLQGDNGWRATYGHLNDDTPGTDDDQGELRFTFSSGIQEGSHVAAGQLLGYVGNSGNAKPVGPHLHFELMPPESSVVDPAPYLKTARALSQPIPARVAASTTPQPKPGGLGFVALPTTPLAGVVPIQLSSDPVARRATTFYTVCVDGRECLRFDLTPSLGSWDSRQVANGRHQLTLHRHDRASGKRVTIQERTVTVDNSDAP